MSTNTHAIEEKYITCGFKVEQLLKEAKGRDTIVVDSYFGPPELKPDIKAIDPDELLSQLTALRREIQKQIRGEPRRTYLIKQIDAMKLLTRFALEEKITFTEKVRIGLDVEVITVPSERIDELTEQASRALRQEVLKGNLTSMATSWRKRAMTTGAEIIPLAEKIALQARQSTERLLFKLPETEKVEFHAVPDAPWSAYNYYQGNFRAIIEINIKLPRSKYDIWKWVTHETYPGHQTDLVQRELGFQKATHNLEATISIINTPDCTIAEGLAEAVYGF